MGAFFGALKAAGDPGTMRACLPPSRLFAVAATRDRGTFRAALRDPRLALPSNPS
jgi:hypothetical protein